MKRNEFELQDEDVTNSKGFRNFVMKCNERCEKAVSDSERKEIEKQYVSGAYQFIFSKWKRMKAKNRKLRDAYFEMFGMKMLHLYEKEGRLMYTISRMKFD